MGLDFRTRADAGDALIGNACCDPVVEILMLKGADWRCALHRVQACNQQRIFKTARLIP